MISNRIDLKYLVAEANGQASLSRFRFLIFTFVVAISYLLALLHSLDVGVSGGDPADPAAGQTAGWKSQ
jgi:hypothetical protein